MESPLLVVHLAPCSCLGSATTIERMVFTLGDPRGDLLDDSYRVVDRITGLDRNATLLDTTEHGSVLSPSPLGVAMHEYTVTRPMWLSLDYQESLGNIGELPGFLGESSVLYRRYEVDDLFALYANESADGFVIPEHISTVGLWDVGDFTEFLELCGLGGSYEIASQWLRQ